MQIKKFIADYIVKPFKRFPYLGRQRFWVLYWAYRLTGWHIRHKEWDWVLEYFPELHNEEQHITVLDVGSTSSLFIYELDYRGYNIWGSDIRPYQCHFEKFCVGDICKWSEDTRYNLITCISVLEHIGNKGKGNIVKQKIAIRKMIHHLEVGGRLILTCPTKEFAIGHIWHGFTRTDIESMLPSNARIYEYTERAGQLCLCIGRDS